MFNASSQFPNEGKTLGFTWLDHLVFIFLLGVSALVGIWFGYCGKKGDSAEEYLLGGRSMRVIPIALSLTTSFVSGITLLGVPSDIYMFGTSFWLGTFNVIPIGLIGAFIYLPVFLKVQPTSVYEYLELRFNSKVRISVSIMRIIGTVAYAPIVIYVPALAFSQVTGINLHLIIPVVCFICIFYTTVGGLKAVVWTDAIQFFAIIASTGVVLLLGINSLGGFESIWNTAVEGGRIDFFNMNPDPTLRNSFWSVQFGIFALWLSDIAIGQSNIQRFLSLPTKRDAYKAMGLFVVCLILLYCITCFTGLILYAKYKGCDPLTTGQIKRPDQILPYFVTDIAGHIYGLPGIFIAGVFSAALSTLSTVLNSLAAVIYKDFVSSHLPKDISERSVNTIMKAVVIAIGVINTVVAFVVDKLGGVLQLSTTFGGAANGPILGLFSLGMMFPWANSKGALWGGLISLAIMSTIAGGSQYHIAQKHIVYDSLPLSTEACNFTFNSTSTNTTVANDEDLPFVLFRISYYYNTLLGALVVFIVGLPVSWFTKSEHYTVDPDLISPAFHWLLPEDRKLLAPSYKSVQNALKSVTHTEEKM